MEVPKNIQDSFPKYDETFFQIKVHLLALDKCKIAEIYPKHYDVVLTRTVYRFAVYLQTVLHRVLDLSQSIINAWELANVGTAFVLLRALYENVSVIYDANKRLEKLIEQKDFKSIYILIFNLQYGTRDAKSIKEFVEKEMSLEDKDEAMEITEDELIKVITSQQILDLMDRIKKVYPEHREIYEHLCEYAHPNYDGLMGLYGKYKDKLTIQLSKDNGINDINVSNFFSCFERLLKMFAESHDAIVHKFNDITYLSNEDLKSKGRESELYRKLFK